MHAAVEPEERSARFEALFRAEYPAVAGYIGRRAEPDSVDDLVDEVFLVAWRRLERVPAEPRPWLLTVAHNHVRNHRRRTARDRALVERLPPPEPTPPPREPGGPGWRDIRRALDALSDEDRELVLLVAWDGLSPAQAASVLGLTPAAARTRLHRARVRLADLLGVEHRRGKRLAGGLKRE